MKAKRILIAALCAAILTGCSASNDAASTTMFQNSKSYSDPDISENYDGGYYSGAADEVYGTSATGEPSEEANVSGDDGKTGLTADSIQKEMLVYSCYMTVDTLKFDSSLNSFKNTLEQYGGFVETENFNDGGNDGRWYSENEQKWKSYSATVRIPSKNYDAFCNSAGTLGDLRSKTSNVDNLSQEYSDLNTSLEIYEAKEQRYIALLAEITEDEYAVAVERELTDIQVKIAEIKTRMNRISTDVAYSYVYFTLNEVKEYMAEPVKTDTFLDRLGYTLSNAGSTFLDFLENLLFFLIYVIPYLVLIAAFVFVIVLIIRKIKKRRKSKKSEALPLPEAAEEKVPETEKKEKSDKD